MGQDFHPSYLKILDFVKSLKKRPVVSAFTATATREVREDILCVLDLRQRFGINVILGTLRGRDNAKLKSYGLQKCQSFGSLEHLGEERIKDILNLLLQEDLLCTTMDEYALVKITAKGQGLMRRYIASLTGREDEEEASLLMSSV